MNKQNKKMHSKRENKVYKPFNRPYYYYYYYLITKTKN